MAVNDNGSDLGEHGETGQQGEDDAQQQGPREHRQTRHGDDREHQHRGEG